MVRATSVRPPLKLGFDVLCASLRGVATFSNFRSGRSRASPQESSKHSLPGLNWVLPATKVRQNSDSVTEIDPAPAANSSGSRWGRPFHAGAYDRRGAAAWGERFFGLPAHATLGACERRGVASPRDISKLIIGGRCF